MLQAASHANDILSRTGFAVQEVPNRQVRYTSGSTIYVESGDGERWLGCYWSADGRINIPHELWADDAFRLEIDGHPLAHGWTWLAASETASSRPQTREFMVSLYNAACPVEVKVHTQLDGSPVLTRWLEITNKSARPLALTGVAPWCGRLWLGWNFALGRFTRDIWAREGWFEWEQLPRGATTLKCTKGQSHDDPFFVLRNEVAGEYFIGQLAWSANWMMEFRRDDKGLLFAIGPEAVAAQRVIAPGETVVTPAVHLGHVSGDFDTAVQAMHEHLRHFVIPKPDPERFGLVQYLIPSDQGYHMPFDEASALK